MTEIGECTATFVMDDGTIIQGRAYITNLEITQDTISMTTARGEYQRIATGRAEHRMTVIMHEYSITQDNTRLEGVQLKGKREEKSKIISNPIVHRLLRE